MTEADDNGQAPLLDEFLRARGWRRRRRGSGWEVRPGLRSARLVPADGSTFALKVGGLTFALHDEAAVIDFFSQSDQNRES
ncbi:hypothetical protein [Microbacterium enclense]|uniref:hypothetical protein n=1 Tax=Microbacterium enclense TaxID=993073 RepID=UPI0034264796